MSPQLRERLKVDRVHVAPRAFELSSAPVRRRYSNMWEPVEDVATRLHSFPLGLVRFWLSQPGGHVVLTNLPSSYVGGELRLKHGPASNVACVGIADLAAGSPEALVPLGHLLDHLAGCGGAPEGQWLSEGGGISPDLVAVGMRVQKLFALGYGFDTAARRDERTYFARSLAMYLTDRRVLNVADPQIEKLFRTTLFSEGFWRPQHMPA